MINNSRYHDIVPPPFPPSGGMIPGGCFCTIVFSTKPQQITFFSVGVASKLSFKDWCVMVYVRTFYAETWTGL